ncbi:MAG: sensor histidine kinase N-terminal domain-containing protein [Methylobacillus sp.]|jgi:two-component system sensor histidine kinase QseC|nr:sensor histidine kinase N-terminal domain-containing protein [Methylobacillus sp.]
MKNASLKTRLLLPVLGIITVVWTAVATYTYIDTQQDMDEVLDAHLVQTAALVDAETLDRQPQSSTTMDTEHTRKNHKYARNIVFQVWDMQGTLYMRSSDAPEEPLAAMKPGFSNVKVDGHHWRVFTTWDNDHDSLIQIAEHSDRREHIAREVALHLLLPLLFTLPVLALLMWLAIAKALRPLRRLADDVAHRAPENLAPLEPGVAPAEITPLIQRLNELFARIRNLLDNERRFTADAAHELRTPVAAIRAQAQVARAAEDTRDRQSALDKAIAGCDRATRLISQLLTLARLDVTQKSAQEPCELRAIASEIIAELAPAALAKNIRLELADSAEQTVWGYPELLRVLLRNLLGNAIAHTPAGTQVTVQAEARNGKPALIVSDDGPGVDAETLARLAERFYRPPGTEAPGSGLGLSIAHRIAELHNARFAMSSEVNRGLRIEVVFP